MKAAGLPLAFVNKAWSHLTGYAREIKNGYAFLDLSIYLYLYEGGVAAACLCQQGLDQSYGVRARGFCRPIYI